MRAAVQILLAMFWPIIVAWILVVVILLVK
jgi:hypothetical protein